MRLIGGLLRLDGAPAEEAVAAAMARAMTPAGLSPRVAWRAEGPLLLVALDFGGGGDALFEGPDGSLIAADVRLDRPREAAAALGLPTEAAPEAIALAAVARYGDATPDRLDGDYALAVYDPRARRLTLARDLAAARTLYWGTVPGRLFAFASLPKGLHGSGLISARRDVAALARQMIRPGLTASSGFLDIAGLPAAHVLTVSADGTTRLARGWTPDVSRVGAWRGSHEEASEILRGLVTDAVEIRTPATGGLAAHLSGGLDSSAVAVIAARRMAETGRSLETFAFLMAEETGTLADFDRPLVEAVVSQEPAIRCLRIPISPAISLAGVDPDLPLGGYGMAPQSDACAAAAAAGARMVLTGAGGDEGATYNGAHIHAALLRAGRFGPLIEDLPARARRENRPLSRVVLQRLIRPSLPAALRKLESRLRGWDDGPGFRDGLALLAPELRDVVGDRSAPSGPPSNAPRDRARMISDSYLQPRNDNWTLLGALHGLAFSHPLLDRRVIDFSLGLPLERFLHGGHSRQPYRAAMAGILPDVTRFNDRKGAPRDESARALIAAKPMLLAACAELRRGPAAEVVDVEAVTAAISALPERAEDADQRIARRATIAARALAMSRRLEADA